MGDIDNYEDLEQELYKQIVDISGYPKWGSQARFAEITGLSPQETGKILRGEERVSLKRFFDLFERLGFGLSFSVRIFEYDGEKSDLR